MKRLPIIALVLSLVLPFSAAAQTNPSATPPSTSAPYQFQRQGIFDCNLNGAYAMSVGATSAQGGAYVPVADATVELNTGILVYKECVLREVIDREREAATAAYGKRAVVAIQQGRGGNPQYVVNYAQEDLENTSDPAFLTYLRSGLIRSNSALQQPVTRALARQYENQTRNSGGYLSCAFKGDLLSYQNGTTPFNFSDFLAGSEPQCDPILLETFAEDQANARIALARYYQQQQLQAGRGYYPVTDNASDPLAQRILTPAVNVQESFQTLLDSPVRQLESANDVGQMIGALYAGLTTQILSDSQGLAGLTQPVGGRPSYLDQVAAESAQGVRNAAVNVALRQLNEYRQVETAYFQTVNAIATALTNAVNALRGAENQCWNLIIPKVCDGNPLESGNTCNGADGTHYQIATSTAFSTQALQKSNVPQLIDDNSANVKKSQQAIGLIDNLIQGVTNTASLDAQRLALQQLDSLTAKSALHIAPDLTLVTQQYQAVQGAMDTLKQDTATAWRTSTDPSVGWCNIDNPTVVQAWKDHWKK